MKCLTDTLTGYNDLIQTMVATQKNAIIINKQLNQSTYIKFIFLVFLLILFVTMVYGPIAAFLVEMFPTKIRYTSMSLPYHIGNGVFGGLTPFIATLLTTIYVDDKLSGLMYPILIAAVCLVIGTLYISNKIDPDVTD
jgi:Sugar (and other) transporter